MIHYTQPAHKSRLLFNARARRCETRRENVIPAWQRQQQHDQLVCLAVCAKKDRKYYIGRFLLLFWNREGRFPNEGTISSRQNSLMLTKNVPCNVLSNRFHTFIVLVFPPKKTYCSQLDRWFILAIPCLIPLRAHRDILCVYTTNTSERPANILVGT